MQTSLPEKIPSEMQITDCMAQLVSKNSSSYGEVVQKYARLRLADFSELLKEWQNEEYAAKLGMPTLPQVAEMLRKGNVLPEQGKKLAAFLQQTAKQGNTTGALYLAYLCAKGLFIPQSLQKTAQCLRFAINQGDWRATRFLGELLIAVPLAARELVGDEIQAEAAKWQATNNHISPEKVEHSCRRFYDATPAIKFLARSKLEQAVQQGSPSVQQRIKGLSVLGELPSTTPPKQFQSISNWLDLQFLQPQEKYSPRADKDIVFLPDNIPLLPLGDDDEKPTWHKPAMYGLMLLVAVLIFTVLLQIVMRK
ncbi:hypothetical protein MIS45_02625 [Wielerella bovis]|uniref:hypothetical protein n=1 Tax=Wielerella bovis TaxID=2917790 RepID=UPI0020198586|nr:hypothetical protein [Wielerella bovis]ULJ69763.1 hypothetical protein MIS45_02625 [Wielerella bovis]